MNRFRISQLLVTLAAALFAVAWSPAVWSQDDDYAELSTAQRELNEAAVQAIIKEDYETGIQMLRSSLQLQPLNIIYLNLGRSLSKVGRCEEALDAYGQVLAAPRVRQPTPEQVGELLATYQLDLQETCEGTLVIRCQPLDAQLSINGEPPVSCLEQPFKLPAGEHSLTATAEGAKADVTEAFSIRGTKTTEIEIEVEVVATPPDGNGNGGGNGNGAQRPAETSYGLIIAGSVLGTLGVGGLVTAIVLENIGAETKAEFDAGDSSLADDVKTLRTSATAMWIVGGALTATALGLIIYHLIDEDEPDDTTNVGFWALPDSAGLTFGVRF